MVDAIVCGCVVCARAMDADEGKEIIRRMKKEQN